MADYQAAAELRPGSIKFLGRLHDTLNPTSGGAGKWLKAAADGYARFSREKYLSGTRLRGAQKGTGRAAFFGTRTSTNVSGSQRLAVRSGRLRRSTRGVTVRGGRAAVVAGGRVGGVSVDYALPHEVGSTRRVFVNTYHRRSLGTTRVGEVKAHQKWFRTPAKYYLRDAIRRGSRYAQEQMAKVPLLAKYRG